jgi:hypothetical protein
MTGLRRLQPAGMRKKRSFPNAWQTNQTQRSTEARDEAYGS